MNNYKLTIGLESSDPYEKAKQDLLQALKSYGELSQPEKEKLMREFFGEATVATFCNALKHYFG